MLIKQKSPSLPKNLVLRTYSIFDESGISLPVFPSRFNISVTPTMVKKVITKLHSSKAFGTDFILVVVLKNCEPDLSHILAELFNMCLKESCFPDCCKVSLVVQNLRMLGKVCS